MSCAIEFLLLVVRTTQCRLFRKSRTWQSKPGDVEAAVEVALKAGYRHIDTAQAYQNEAEIGVALKKCLEEGVCQRVFCHF